MGIDNVKAAMFAYRHLDPRAQLLLQHMAMVSMDHPKQDKEARRYYCHWTTMALVLGYRVPPQEATDTASVRARETARTGTRKVIRRLKAAKAIKVVRAEAPQRSTEYELMLL
jgi:hypothetical protein